MFVNERSARLQARPKGWIRRRAIAPAAVASGLLLAVAIVAASTPASAQLAISQYDDILRIADGKHRSEGAATPDNARKFLAVFHDGMDSAIAVANAAFIQAGAKPSFCLPTDAETTINLMSKVRKEVLDGKKWSQEGRASIGRVAIAILTADHPCK